MMMAMLLEEIFPKLCAFLDGKLRWSGPKTKFTNVMLWFFENLAKQKEHIKGQQNYLNVDYVWHCKNNSYYLELAVEHENKFKFGEFLSKEIQHLTDVKAYNKVAITYPSFGEEKPLIEEIRKMIKRSAKLEKPERYLVILGFSTKKKDNGRKKRAILLRAYHITQEGEISKTDQTVIFQGEKTFTLKIEAVDEKGRPLRIPFKIERVDSAGQCHH